MACWWSAFGIVKWHHILKFCWLILQSTDHEQTVDNCCKNLTDRISGTVKIKGQIGSSDKHDDSNVDTLANFLRVDAHIRTLDVSCTSIGSAGLVTLMKMVHDHSTLTALDISSNDLGGFDVANISEFCKPLRVFKANSCSLKGQITGFSTLTYLEKLHLFNNEISGEIPDFSGTPNLQHLHLRKNRLSGRCPKFDACSKLFFFDVSGNKDIFGHVDFFVDIKILPALKVFSVGSTNVVFPLVPSLKKMLHLVELGLHNLSIEGIVPDFSKITALRVLDISRNELRRKRAGLKNWIIKSSLERIHVDRNREQLITEVEAGKIKLILRQASRKLQIYTDKSNTIYDYDKFE